MDNLKEFSNEEIIKLIKEGKVGARELTDSGICPTCFNRANNGVLYGDDTDKLVYTNEDFDCFLVGNPRCEGHMAIISKKHYKDMMDIDDELCTKVFLFSKKMMNIVKEVYNSESVYLCTMCDGPMNHFHVQLIPRYKHEKRGSNNFVKPRVEFVGDDEKLLVLRNKSNNL